VSAGLVAGVDIGGSKALAVVVDDSNRVLGQVRQVTQRGAAGVVATAADVVRQAAQLAGATVAELSAVGVGIPGLVHPANGSVSHAVNLDLGADPVDLSAALQRELEVPVSVENDVNAVAVGAHRISGTTGTDLAVLSIGTGLAAGIVVDGRLHRGSRGGAGEVGHIPVDPLGRWCSCGQRGCLETIASGSALSAAWQPPQDDGTTVWSAAARGDQSAVAAVSSFGAGVAAAVRLLVLAWDVEHVVLAGGVTEVGQPLLDVVRSQLVAAEGGSAFLAAMRLAERVSLLPSQSPVAAVGAAVLARQSLLATVTPISEAPVRELSS
jgi:predicted NBD/HSP70 family sugar kinase